MNNNFDFLKKSIYQNATIFFLFKLHYLNKKFNIYYFRNFKKSKL